jgi:signal transduction histidine kinase
MRQHRHVDVNACARESVEGAHDLNNLLGIIRNYAELALEDASLAPRLRDDIAEIRDAAEGALAIVRRLFDPASANG